MRVANTTPGTGALASIYAVDSTASPIAGSVVTTDSTGTFNFYAPDGRHDLVVAFGATTKIVADIEIADITEGNTGDLPWLVRNFESIRYADQFPGADYGIKIANAIADLPASGGVVDARAFTGTISTATNPFAGTLPQGLIVLFGNAVYQSSVQWLISQDVGIKIVGSGVLQTTLQYTGSAIDAFIKVSTATPTITFIQQIYIGLMLIRGSANVTDTVLIAGCHRSQFENLDLKDATQSCFHSTFAVTCTYKNLSCSNSSGAFVSIPSYGFMFDSIGGLQTTDGTVTDIRAEGIKLGIYLKSASSMTFTSGTSESNTGTAGVGGVQLDINSANNTFIGMDMEANTTIDALDNGNSTIFANVIAISAGGISLGANSRNAKIIGGNVASITINSAAVNPGGLEKLPLNVSAVKTFQGVVNSGSIGWNQSAGHGEIDLFSNVFTANGLESHTFWAVNSLGTAYVNQGGFLQGGNFVLRRGVLSIYSGLATAGNGVPAIFGATSQKSEVAADTNVLTFTPPAVAGSYRIRFTLAASAAASAVVGWTATWKDANGNAKAPTNLSLFQVGTAVPALTFTTSTTDNFYGEAQIDIDGSATNIVIKFTLGSGTITAKASATIERLI